MTNKIGGLSPRKWSLLALPAMVAFIVGGGVPTLFDNGFSIGAGILWAMVILIIDYNVMRINKLHWFVATCRVLIILCSALTTATVGELYIFKSDVAAHNESLYSDQYSDYEKQLKVYDNEIGDLERKRDCQDPDQPKCIGVVKGLGKVYRATVKRIEELKATKLLVKPPSREAFKGNILQKIKVIHSLISANSLVAVMYGIFTLLILLIEALPIILKGAKVS